MYQLRIYTLRTSEALEQYAVVHWTRHITSLGAFGVTTHGIWTERDGHTHRLDGHTHRLIALIRYPDSADPTRLTAEYMASPEFASDMDGFDPQDIVSVDSILLDATENSPIR